MRKNYILGIDIGSISIKIVLLNEDGLVTLKDCCFHNGNVYEELKRMLRSFPVKKLHTIGVVSEKGREYLKTGIEVNEQVAIIEGVKHFIPDPRSIITIGGESFGLILFNENGQYKKYISNSACAAGTGSFLDQQAARLGLAGSAEISELAQSYKGVPPKIATRCAVFAKSDLVHMQQQGYGLPAIAAGLSRGVAQNICNTLFPCIKVLKPIVVVGGVSRNKKLVQYLEEEIHNSIQSIPDSEYTGAVGAALSAFKQSGPQKQQIPLILKKQQNRKIISGFYPPLIKQKSVIPDFSGWKSFVQNDVEIDIYEPLTGDSVVNCYFGIDIGSTSTKAVLMTRQKKVIAGLYTRTSGQPVKALQKITRTIEGIEKQFNVNFSFLGSGTTGSGRKFINKIARTDFFIDEITAHAAAAYFLNPEIDTIIEIGGQDSKFTVMNNGNVTFSVMNFVCAAGTGSFIEEQARHLGVPLNKYAALAETVSAPIISDRCTVFMQRDLNHLLCLGYKKEELLAAVLHSVRDNYLSKVAHINKIGSHITFQGATAKNYALVKAFEQKLQKPVYTSKFCHLTGAIGVCLKLVDMTLPEKSGFRKKLHTEKIAAGEYICSYCNNHCKIKTIEINGETLGWGYLCGRDENESRFLKKDGARFDLLWNHRKVFDIPENKEPHQKDADINLFNDFKKGGIKAIISHPELSLARIWNRIQFNMLDLRNEIFSSGIHFYNKDKKLTRALKIGLPATLTMTDYLPLWELFFKQLGFKIIVTSKKENYIFYGNEIKGADFCTPITDFHGHIRQLASIADFIFFPQLFENTLENEKKAFCYYCHYAVPIIQNIPELKLGDKIIAPVLNFNKNINEIIRTVYLQFPEPLKKRVSYAEAEEAFFTAWNWYQKRKADLKYLFMDQLGVSNDISIVLLGRPYLILNPSLNKGIPERFAAMGIQSFSMDMIPIDDEKLDASRDFIKLNHWHYGNIIIKAAETAAQTDGLFPVYITAFKCAPDSFIMEYFKSIMDYYNKPYLILQLDEHEAAEGYDTRLEAAVETFRNFKSTDKRGKKPEMVFKKSFEDKIYLIPGYDPLSARFIQGAFIHSGIKTLIIEETEETISQSLKINDGQCLPVSILTQGIVQTMEKHNLKPEEIVFFCNSDVKLSCNLPQYPPMIKQSLEKMKLEKIDIIVTKFLPENMPIDLMYSIYMAYILAGYIQKIVFRIRPRENVPGETDRCFQNTIDMLFECFSKGSSKEETFKRVVNDFLKIETHNGFISQVGIIGDLYVRDNDVFNQNLVRHIENAGAEVITVPFINTLTLLSNLHFKSLWIDGSYLNLIRDKAAYNILNVFIKKLDKIVKPIINGNHIASDTELSDYLKKHFLTIKHTGETSENILKIYYLKENYPDLKLLVNVNPVFCCPGLISEAIYKNVEKEIGIPIVSITYDGTKTNKNKVLDPYLHFMK